MKLQENLPDKLVRALDNDAKKRKVTRAELLEVLLKREYRL